MEEGLLALRRGAETGWEIGRLVAAVVATPCPDCRQMLRVTGGEIHLRQPNSGATMKVARRIFGHYPCGGLGPSASAARLGENQVLRKRGREDRAHIDGAVATPLVAAASNV